MSEAARQIPEKEDSSSKPQTFTAKAYAAHSATSQNHRHSRRKRTRRTVQPRRLRPSLLRAAPHDLRTCKSRFSTAASAIQICTRCATSGRASCRQPIPVSPATRSSDAWSKSAEPSRNSRKATSPQSVAWWTLAASAQVVSLGKSSFVRSS